MEKKIYRYEVGIVQKLAGHNEPGFLGGFKSVEDAFDYIDKYKDNDGEENIVVEEYIEYEDGEEICNRFPVECEDAEPYIESVTTYRCEGEDAPYLWRIKYLNGNVKDVWRESGYPDDDVIDFMAIVDVRRTFNPLTMEYEAIYC